MRWVSGPIDWPPIAKPPSALLTLPIGGDHRGGAAGEGLGQPAALRVGPPLLDRIGLLAHRRCPCSRARVRIESRVMPGKIVPLSGGVAIDAVVEDEEDVHAAQFLDPAALDRVEEDDLVAAVADRLGLGDQAGRIIAAAFGGAGAAGAARVYSRVTQRETLGAPLK